MLKSKPYYLFAIAAVLIFIEGLFLRHSILDIHLSDTYFVFSNKHFAWLLLVALAGFFLLYLATDGALFSKKLTWIHVIITVLGFLLLAILPFHNIFSYEGLAGMPRRYIDYGSDFRNGYHHFLLLFTAKMPGISVFIFLLAQVLYVVNLVMGLIRPVK